VFFIRDGIQFPDLVHCLRPNPKNNIKEAWRILDFLSFHPESVNIVSNEAAAAHCASLACTHDQCSAYLHTLGQLSPVFSLACMLSLLHLQ